MLYDILLWLMGVLMLVAAYYMLVITGKRQPQPPTMVMKQLITQIGIDEHDKLKRVDVFQGDKFKDRSKEHFTFTDFSTPVKIMGKFGGNIAKASDVIYRCPKCDYRHRCEFEHGDVMLCECGLYSQKHGNSLDVWE